LPDGFPTLGLEKPSGDFCQGKELPTTAALAGRVTIRLGLFTKAPREHRTGQSIAYLSGLLFQLHELRSPRRIPLGSVQFLVQFRRDRLDPIS
jgi:hypothetical protein